VSVLVTGGAGYIGSHAVKALRAAGQDVVVYDNLSAGHKAAAHAAGAPLEVGDIKDVSRLRNVMSAHGVSAVMHFAAWLSVGESVKEPIAYYENNVGGALAVLRAMVETRVPHFIFSSTAATFGNPIETPITESHPQRPINTYGETKLAIERALPHFERAYGVRSVTLRYFNAAGADPDGALGEDHHPEIHVIPRAIDAALGRDAFSIYGDDYETPDGTCLRDYVHVADLASAHLLSLESLRAGGESAAYNLGNGRPTSVREVVNAVERVTGRTVPVTPGPRRPGDPGVLFASSGKIREALGWTPRYEDIDVIVDTAWRWREAHPQGYGKQ
jgi:UDP-glucose 4-epimerase